MKFRFSLVPALGSFVLSLLGTALVVGCSRQESSAPLEQGSAMPSETSPFVTDFFEPTEGLQLRTVVYRMPAEDVKSYVIYFPGFSDRADNHAALARRFARDGTQFVSLDYPSHGESTGRLNSLDKHTFDDLLDYFETYAKLHLQQYGEKPVSLLGWSTGGLLVAKWATERSAQSFGTSVSRIAMISPAIPPRVVVGRLGTVTAETMSRNTEHPRVAPPSPTIPLLFPIFAARFLIEASNLSKKSMRDGTEALVLLPGEQEDRYTNVQQLKKWVGLQRASLQENLSVLECDGSFHEMHNEGFGVGDVVRESIVRYLEGSPTLTNLQPCAWSRTLR